MTSLTARSKLSVRNVVPEGPGALWIKAVMQVKVITLKYDSVTGRIDDTSLIEFIKDLCRHLVMIVTYQQGVVIEPPSEKKQTKRNRDRWRELLDDGVILVNGQISFTSTKRIFHYKFSIPLEVNFYAQQCH